MLILAPVACFPFVLVGALFSFRSESLKHAIADPAIYTAQTSPAVEEALGLPIQQGWPIRGSVRADKKSGNADLLIPLNGSRGKGFLVQWAQKVDGKWHTCSLLFRPNSGSDNQLVDPAATHCEPE